METFSHGMRLDGCFRAGFLDRGYIVDLRERTGQPVWLLGGQCDAEEEMIILILLTCGLVQDADGPTPLNERVVAFARSRLGQRVGDGQCSALAAEALRAANAARTGRGGSWGRELASPRDARPGDILRFEDAVFVRRRLRPDGALVTLVYRFPHHVAIVAGVRKRGKDVVLTILHQNAGIEGGDEDRLQVVQQWTVNLAEMKGGSLKAFRPVAE